MEEIDRCNGGFSIYSHGWIHSGCAGKYSTDDPGLWLITLRALKRIERIEQFAFEQPFPNTTPAKFAHEVEEVKQMFQKRMRGASQSMTQIILLDHSYTLQRLDQQPL